MNIATIDIRPVLSVLGFFLLGLSVTMFVPAIVDLIYNNSGWDNFVISSIITSFVGLMFFLVSRGNKSELNTKSAFLLVTLSWIVLSIFSSVPFLLSTNVTGITNAFFESVSGLTTTGSTIIDDIESTSEGIIVWRSLLQWLGGIGIIVSAISILPSLGVGGMQLVKLESSDSTERLMPSSGVLATAIIFLYILLTSICATLYWVCGLSFFDSANHAMTTIATGGFSSNSQSIGGYNNFSIEYVCILFMILSSLPFVLYLKTLRGKPLALIKDEQVTGFFKTLFLAIILIAVFLLVQNNFELQIPLRQIIFNVTSILTGTGYTSTSYDQWGTPAIIVFLAITFIGGCAGSTTCGLKVFRLQVILKNSGQVMNKLISPNRVTNHKYNGENLTLEIVESVMTFLFIFFVTFVIISFLLSLSGLDILTSVSAAATSISNVGPGLGNLIGPAYSFEEIPEFSKWVLSFGMLAGRLEFLTFLVIFSRSFWK